MTTNKKKSLRKFGSRYGTRARTKTIEVETKQRKKQLCPFCKKLKVKRLAKGIWLCDNCQKKFASSTFYIE